MSTHDTLGQSVLYCRARNWQSLRAFVLDALADAMHQRAALNGAQPHLSLMLSRRCLPTQRLPAQEVQRQLHGLSQELRWRGALHAIHMVVIGDAEPARHELSIRLSQQ